VPRCAPVELLESRTGRTPRGGAPTKTFRLELSNSSGIALVEFQMSNSPRRRTKQNFQTGTD